MILIAKKDNILSTNTFVWSLGLVNGCSWTPKAGWKPEWHWSLERELFFHLKEKHKKHEMKEVPEHLWDFTIKNFAYDPVAYYNAAVRCREQEHIPLIGPSVDRRMLTLVTKLANSDTIKGLMCFACAQIHTYVRPWTNMTGVETNRPWVNNHSAIDKYTVGQTLSKLEELDAASFGATFTLNYFKDHYACDDAESGNPFERAEELVEGHPEWQRRLLLHEKGTNATLLCCPEDVQHSAMCKHDATALCQHCVIPLCQRCVSTLSGLSSGSFLFFSSIGWLVWFFLNVYR